VPSWPSQEKTVVEEEQQSTLHVAFKLHCNTRLVRVVADLLRER
jgi:hypothetical protein